MKIGCLVNQDGRQWKLCPPFGCPRNSIDEYLIIEIKCIFERAWSEQSLASDKICVLDISCHAWLGTTLVGIPDFVKTELSCSALGWQRF